MEQSPGAVEGARQPAPPLSTTSVSTGKNLILTGSPSLPAAAGSTLQCLRRRWKYFPHKHFANKHAAARQPLPAPVRGHMNPLPVSDQEGARQGLLTPILAHQQRREEPPRNSRWQRLCCHQAAQILHEMATSRGKVSAAAVCRALGPPLPLSLAFQPPFFFNPLTAICCSARVALTELHFFFLNLFRLPKSKLSNTG